jgi:hypothetical protein
MKPILHRWEKSACEFSFPIEFHNEHTRSVKFAGMEEISTECALAEMGINPFPQAAFLSVLFSVI